jgi:hypothetical protein
MDYSLGRVKAVSGTQMTVEADEPFTSAIRIGAMIKTRSVDHDVVGTISALEVEGGSSPRSVFIVDLLGEIVHSSEGRSEFRRGVSHYPISGAPVHVTTDDDVRSIYTRPSVSSVASARSIMIRRSSVRTRGRAAGKFAVLGQPARCAAGLILSAILAGHATPTSSRSAKNIDGFRRARRGRRCR